MSQPPRKTSGIRPPSTRSSLPVRTPAAASSAAASSAAPSQSASTEAKTSATEPKAPEGGLRPPSAASAQGKVAPNERTPKAVTTSSSHSTQSRSPQSDDSEKMVLKAQVKDLSEKVETLMMKRKEDREKLLEYEKVKIQLAQLNEYKKQMTEAQSNLQKQLAVAKKEAKEAVEGKAQQADDIRELEEVAEMATLDKEMAEEKYEQAVKELESTKEKLEEVILELEIMKNEIDNKGALGDASEAVGVTTYEVKQLQSQNEKLREAIIKLRDLSSEDKNELQKMTKEFEATKSLNGELQKNKEKLQEEIRSFESQVIDLKEQIDSALGSQEIIENLTEKNFKLEEEVMKEKEDKDVLEKLLETNELLLEQAKETEQELLQEVDLHRSKLNEALLGIDQAKAVIEDRDQTIIKFRELVTSLRDENEKLRSKSDDSNMARDSVLEHEAQNIEFKIRLQEEKAKNLEMELKKAEEGRVQDAIELKGKIEETKTLSASLEELRCKIESKDSEIHSLKRALKAKVEEASEHQIRRELAERKLSTANKDADDRVVRMQNEVDQLKAEMRRKEKEYEETMNHLQSDIEALESERGALKDRVKNLASTPGAHFDGQKTPLSSRLSHSSPTTSSPSLDDQTVLSLRRALTRLKTENDDLKMKAAVKSLNLTANRVPVSKPIWLLRMQGKENEIDPKQDMLDHILAKVLNFQTEVRSFVLTQTPYDATKDVQQQRKNDLMKQSVIVSKYQELEKLVRDFMNEYNEDWRVETHLDTKFVSPSFQKITQKDEAIVAARLRLPCSTEVKDQGQDRTSIQLEVSLDQLRNLHQRLLA